MNKLTVLQKQLNQELTQNILPFHLTHLVDKANGGFYGSVTNDLFIQTAAPKGSVQCTRLLWTYSQAFRLLKDRLYLDIAKKAADYLLTSLWDAERGGLFWSVTATGQPNDTRKFTYAQAFGIYGLSEYYATTHDGDALQKAKQLFGFLEQYMYGRCGYIEGTNADWEPLATMAIDEVAHPVAMSMNTHLHILEAYTTLYKVWPNTAVKNRLRRLIDLILNHIFDSKSGHLRLHFDEAWQPLNGRFSYGHDIEASWLLWEAVEAINDFELLQTVRPIVLALAEVTLKEGIDQDGGLFDEGDATGIINREKHWWPQAEAMVGFLNAFQMTGEQRYLDQVFLTWAFIQTKIVDSTYGEWIWGVDANGNPLPNDKAGMWKTPYHNGRLCLELLQRIPTLKVEL